MRIITVLETIRSAIGNIPHVSKTTRNPSRSASTRMWLYQSITTFLCVDQTWKVLGGWTAMLLGLGLELSGLDQDLNPKIL